ncbi:hypothetical protein [Pseudonocardia sp. TRM90224]|uniref:hypothetical protein n=1 Tax=Pseudonocardia sp. TRM90224 TaxID=2812678 RepID=UPI001E47F4E6|nr:hypothetical protein [Pseudonocardia sp. TRM90224]
MVGIFTLTGAGSAAAWPFNDCKSPPLPTTPDVGMSGSIDPNSINPGIDSGINSDATATAVPTGTRAPAQGSGAAERDPYSTTGYGGLYWTTYDVGCVDATPDPGASIDTTLGNLIFGAAKALFALHMAMTNLGQDTTSTPTGIATSTATSGSVTAVDEIVAEAATRSGRALYEAVFSPWAGAALVIAAAALLMAARRGDTGTVLTRTILILLAVTVSALSFGSGGQMSRELSGTIRAAMDDVASTVASTAFPDRDQAHGVGVGVELRSVVFRELLWKAWAVGQVGDISGPGEELAWALYQQQALTRDEAERIRTASKDEQIALFQQKGAEWQKIADGAPPAAYRAIQGKAHNRVGAAVMVLLKIIPVSLLQIFGLLVMFAMYAVLALLPIGAPLLGLVGIVFPNAPEKTVRVLGAVIVGGVTAGICTLVHTLILLHLAHGDLNSWATILWIWMTTAVLFALLKPVASLTAILGSLRTTHGRPAVRGGRRGRRPGTRRCAEQRNHRRTAQNTSDSQRCRRPDAGNSPGHGTTYNGSRNAGPDGYSVDSDDQPQLRSNVDVGSRVHAAEIWRLDAERTGGAAAAGPVTAAAACASSRLRLLPDDVDRADERVWAQPNAAASADAYRAAPRRVSTDAHARQDVASWMPAGDAVRRPPSSVRVRLPSAQHRDNPDAACCTASHTGLYRPARRHQLGPAAITALVRRREPLRRPR